MTFTELLTHADICGMPTTGLSFSFLVLLTTGLLAGFSHCAGMCGPLVSAFVIHQRQQKADVTSSLLTFQFGRLTTYVVLGLAAGAVGSMVRITVVDRSWQAGMSMVIGLLMLGAGLNLLGWWPHHLALLPPGFLRQINTTIRRFLPQQHPAAHYVLGLSNALLPCAPVYTMLLVAATTGGLVRGALTMFVFGLGTLPAMLGVGLFAAQLSVRLRGQLFRVSAGMILLVGLQLTMRGLALHNYMLHFSIAGVALW